MGVLKNEDLTLLLQPLVQSSLISTAVLVPQYSCVPTAYAYAVSRVPLRAESKFIRSTAVLANKILLQSTKSKFGMIWDKKKTAPKVRYITGTIVSAHMFYTINQ